MKPIQVPTRPADDYRGDGSSIARGPRALEALLDDAPGARETIRATLALALAECAERVHVEASDGDWRLRLRHDDALTETRLAIDDALPGALALLDERLALSRRAAPAAFTLCTAGERHLVAFARAASSSGDAFVLALRGSALTPPRLDAFGLDARQLTRLRDLVRRPHGWLAVGAAGELDGEQLVRALGQELVSPERMLIALEPPLHPPLARIVQLSPDTPVDTLVTFGADAILLVTPPPDTALAALAARATAELTVVQRVTARRPSEVLGRLLALGLAPAWLALTLPAVLMRHRVRLLCHGCRVAAPSDCDAGHWLGTLHAKDVGDVSRWLERSLERRYRAGPGCEACHGSAHAGVRDIGDVVMADARVRRALLEGDVERASALVDAGTTLAPRLSALVASGDIAAAEATRHLRARY